MTANALMIVTRRCGRFIRCNRRRGLLIYVSMGRMRLRAITTDQQFTGSFARCAMSVPVDRLRLRAIQVDD